jgi:transcriptional regulator with XRE-family HTH domain
MEHDSIHHPYHEVLVAYLRELRVVRNLTQAEVAEQLNRPQTYLSEIENRRRGLDMLQVRRLCEIYNFPFPDFVDEMERRIAAIPKPRRKPKA